MERPIEPNMGPSLADVLLCTFESTNTGFFSFPVRMSVNVVVCMMRVYARVNSEST